MKGLDDHYRTLLAQHQGRIDQNAEEDLAYELDIEDLAFFKSFKRNVVSRSSGQAASDKNITDFLEIMARDNYDQSKTMPEFLWNSIEDAWLMWQDAMAYTQKRNAS